MKVKKEEGFTLIELLIVVAIISIIAAIAVPGLLRARMTGNESSAIASLRTTTSSQVSYSAACGNGGYARSYDVLADAPGGAGQGFISAEFNIVDPILKSGFNLTMVPVTAAVDGPADCNGPLTTSGFFAAGVPLTLGTTGTRSFAVDANMTIFQNTAGTAITNASPIVTTTDITPIQ